MGLFFSSDRFTRPGPGVRPDAPRKKGVARLAEIMGRDMWNFFRAGFLAFLGCLPFIIGMFFAVETHALLFMLLAGIIGGLIAGPELSAMADTVLRSLRDEPGYWWETYRRVWKRNARESLVPGMLTGLVLSIQIFTLFHMSVISAGIVTWVLLILSFVVTLGLEASHRVKRTAKRRRKRRRTPSPQISAEFWKKSTVLKKKISFLRNWKWCRRAKPESWALIGEIGRASCRERV